MTEEKFDRWERSAGSLVILLTELEKHPAMEKILNNLATKAAIQGFELSKGGEASLLLAVSALTLAQENPACGAYAEVSGETTSYCAGKNAISCGWQLNESLQYTAWVVDKADGITAGWAHRFGWAKV